MAVVTLAAVDTDEPTTPGTIGATRAHDRLGTVCAVLGAATLVVVATDRTDPVAAIVVGLTLFLGPGMAVACWRRQSPLHAAWAVLPTSFAFVLVLTRLLLELEWYRPRQVTFGIAAAVFVAGGARGWSGSRSARGERIRAEHIAGTLRPHAPWIVTGVAAVVSCVVGALSTPTRDLTQLGLLRQLSPLWYLGLALTIVTVLLAARVATRDDARSLAGAATVTLIVLHGTASLVYGSAKYAWTYKHIGFADYFGRFHDDDRAAVDIYHAFPAFFSAIGVVAGTVGAESLEIVAKWWPLLIEAGSLLLIRRIFEPITPDRRVPWAAGLLFLVTNWIGQDYLSPQSVGLLLALAIYAIAFGQLRTDEYGVRELWSMRHAKDVTAVVAIVACWIAIVVSHPLTPFLVLPGIVVGFPLLRIRPRPLPLVLTVIALGHAWLQRGIVERQGIGSSVGNLVTNVQSRGTTNNVVATRVDEFRFYFMAAFGLSAVALALAALGMRALHRSVGRRRFVALACQAISPTLFLIIESYGQEGVLRAFLFASPWLCLSAAMLLCQPDRLRRRRGSRLLLAGLAVGMASLFTVATFVRDLQYAVAGTDVAVMREFEDQNPDGGLLIGTGVMPERVTATWYRQRYVVLAAAERFEDGTIDAQTTLDIIREEIEAFDRPVSIAFGPSLTNRSIFDGRMSALDLQTLERAVEADPNWVLTFRDGPSSLYRWERS